MRQLMRHDHAESALLIGRGLVIHHQNGIVIEIRPGVLHRPGQDRCGYLIELWIGKRLAEIVFKVGDNALRSLQRKGQLVGILSGRDNPQRQRSAALRRGGDRTLQHRKWPDHHRHQIGRQRQGWRKAVNFEAIFHRSG